MKKVIAALIVLFLFACKEKEQKKTPAITGTWKLLKATVIEKGDTLITDYTAGRSFIKIINETHFSFLQHDLNGGKDSTSSFSAGGGSYSIDGDKYTEHLEYCNAREWEGHDFTFTITLHGDTLVQSGVEKIESQGIDRINTEKYIRIKVMNPAAQKH